MSLLLDCGFNHTRKKIFILTFFNSVANGIRKLTVQESDKIFQDISV